MRAPELAGLVPHRGRALLLDRVVSVRGATLTAELTVRRSSPFSGDQGVGAWIGLEYMAQAAAALAGHERPPPGGSASPGALLGTRRFTCNRPRFPVGATLAVSAEFDGATEHGAARYVCSIVGGDIRAEATIAVFQTESADHSFESERP